MGGSLASEATIDGMVMDHDTKQPESETRVPDRSRSVAEISDLRIERPFEGRAGGTALEVCS